MGRIAIISTVYNTEEYISEMIESVLNQTYRDFLFLIIDDCSTDNSLKIIKHYSEMDKRIHLISLKKNIGLAGARNQGIEFIKKNTNDVTHFTFVDSDDYLETHYLERLYNAYLDTKSSIVISAYTHDAFFDSDRTETIKSTDYYKNRNKYKFFPSNCATSKLFDCSLLGIFSFPIAKKHEDIFIIPKIIMQNDVVTLVYMKLYFYRIREHSITSENDFFSNRFTDRLDALQQNLEFVIENKKDCLYHFANEYFEQINELIFRSKSNRALQHSFVNRRKESLEKYLKIFSCAFSSLTIKRFKYGSHSIRYRIVARIYRLFNRV